ncbi:MAG: 30S ribosomal protein S20 [Nitrospirota bacterium]
MAKHISVLKRQRQAEKRCERNKMIKSAIKTAIKKANKAVEDKDVNNAKIALSSAIKSLNKAVSKGIIHRNNASRNISRLTRKVNQLIASLSTP